MKFIQATIFFSLLMLAACQKENAPFPPGTDWPLFNTPGTLPLGQSCRMAMEGVYKVTSGTNKFGSQVALKWSYLANGQDTSYYLSVFTGNAVCFFVLEGKQLGDSILLNGYWRDLTNTDIGTVRFIISAASGATELLGPNPIIGADSVMMTGRVEIEDAAGGNNFTITYLRPLFQAAPFEILAHRGGGSSSVDVLPQTENSIGMIAFASRMGATGIEIDVSLTSDLVPVVYHDNTLNLRLIQKNGLGGPIVNYTYDQLNNLVRLGSGERIPTLREALETVIYKTNLRLVWLDTKDTDSLELIRNIQDEFAGKAAAAGRSVEFLMGLPSGEQVDKFKRLARYDTIPSLCELGVEDVEKINARVWAPRWTLGTQDAAVETIHALGKRAFAWTLDDPDYIATFIRQGQFDGILSDYSPLVAYHYYVRQ